MYTTHGVYLEVAEPSRLVMTQRWDDSVDHSEITLTLNEKEEGTEVVFEHRRLPSEPARDSHAEGWSEALDRLEHQVGS